jgi:hypothetical protein
MIAALRLRVLARFAPVVLLLLGAAGAARADPPTRVGRLGEAEGTVSYAPAGDNEWTDLQRNRPLTRGDRLWTDRGTRAELQVGSSAIRLNGQTRLEILALDEQSTQLSVTQGSVSVRVRSLPEGENFEIDTPNLAYRAAYPGDYRIDVDPAQGTTRVTIHSGTGAVFGDNGQTLQLGGGQQITFRARTLTQVASQESPPEDAFDGWAMERNRREDQSIAARYVPREIVGYQQLDPYGQWRRDATFGAIWFPQGMPAGWAPYRGGHWDWVAPWGWTWIDDAPWGFAPFHYGRWTLVDDRWAWVPGRLSVQPVYAPALVAFVGGSQSERTWFPLAPNEAWQPWYPASALYISNVNRNIPLAPLATYAYQRRPEALSAIGVGEFDRGRPAASGWWRIAANLLTNPPIVPAPPVPEHRLALTRAAKPAPNVPPPAAAVRQVAAQAASPAPALAARPAVAMEQHPGTAVAPVVPAAPVVPQPQRQRAAVAVAPVATQPGEPAPRAQPERRSQRHVQPQAASREAAAPRLRETARAAATTRAPQAARAVAAARLHEERAARERSRRQEAVVRAEHARRLELARREQVDATRRQARARHEQQLRLAHARREEQVRRQARARADDQLRRDMHASHVEQARRVAERDAQALRQQRLQREAQLRELIRDGDAQSAAPLPQAQPSSELRQRQRARPDLRQDTPVRQPEIWQRGYPLVSPGPTS